VKKRSGLYPWVGVDRTGSGVVSQAGGVTLVETVRVSGLDRELSAALAPRRKPAAVHDPAKVLCDLAISLQCRSCQQPERCAH
jgi:Transposase DDE domain group 1